MPDLYNLTAMKESNGIVDMIVAANNAWPSTAAGQPPQILMGGMLIAIFTVMLFLLRKSDFVDSMLASSFVCFILSLLLRSAMGLEFMYILVFGFLMGIGAVLKIYHRKN